MNRTLLAPAILFALLAGVSSALAQPATESAGGGAAPVVRVVLDSPIHPMAARWLQQVLDDAEADGAAAVLVELDTPGGSLESTRHICQSFLGSPVPVIVYVGPSGAQAASAGFFLLMAADVAAMAPGTNTGAAHPVGSGGEDIEGEMGQKVEQDTLALIRALAEERGRDLDVAQSAVLESRSFTASEALEAGLVDHVAESVPALLAALDGTEIRRGEKSWRLATAEAPIEDHEMSPEQRLLAALAHPQIAGLLMAFGLLGLYAEISNPGLILPGVVGAICLILGFFALSVLPIDYAGVALLLLALVLFVAETQVPTFGALTLGGAVSLGLGLTMLADEVDPALRPNPWWAISTAGLVALVAGIASIHTVRSRRRPPVTGRDGMLGELGTVRKPLDPRGTVAVHGEIWNAEAEIPLAAGTPVVVTAIDGLSLRVRPAPELAVSGEKS